MTRCALGFNHERASLLIDSVLRKEAAVNLELTIVFSVDGAALATHILFEICLVEDTAGIVL